MVVHKYADEAYRHWAARHPDTAYPYQRGSGATLPEGAK
jgi:hypothetical protein